MRSLALFAFVLLLIACAPASAPGPGLGKREAEEATRPRGAVTPSVAPGPSAAPTPRLMASGLRTEPVADGLQLPANLAFAPDGRLFLTEVSLGRVRIVDRGSLLPEPFVQLDPATRQENGLLGLALDPEFARTHYLYLFYSQASEGRHWRNRVVRFTEVGGKGTDMQVILDDLPNAMQAYHGSHNGGRLAFGPDGKLYVTLGDVGHLEFVQNRDKLVGKLLRLNPDGSIPTDNPFPDSPVYALGFRNPWGLTFHPATGVPYLTDNGEQGHDEVNRVQAGGNYGHPKVEGARRDPRFIDPLWESRDDRGGITGLTFYASDLFREYQNDLLFCTFSSGYLIRLRLAPPIYDRVEGEEVLSDGCYTDVTTGPDGAIYFASINRVERLVPAR